MSEDYSLCRRAFNYFMVLYAFAISLALIIVPHYTGSSCCIPKFCNVEGLRNAPPSPFASAFNKGIDPPHTFKGETADAPRVCLFTPAQYEAMNCSVNRLVSFAGVEYERCQWGVSYVFQMDVATGSLQLIFLLLPFWAMHCKEVCGYDNRSKLEFRRLPTYRPRIPLSTLIVWGFFTFLSMSTMLVMLYNPYQIKKSSGYGTLPTGMDILLQIYDADQCFAMLCLNFAVIALVWIIAFIQLCDYHCWCLPNRGSFEEARTNWKGTFWFMHLNRNWYEELSKEEASKPQREFHEACSARRERMAALRTKMAKMKKRVRGKKLSAPTTENLSEENHHATSPGDVPASSVDSSPTASDSDAVSTDPLDPTAEFRGRAEVSTVHVVTTPEATHQPTANSAEQWLPPEMATVPMSLAGLTVRSPSTSSFLRRQHAHTLPPSLRPSVENAKPFALPPRRPDRGTVEEELVKTTAPADANNQQRFVKEQYGMPSRFQNAPPQHNNNDPVHSNRRHGDATEGATVSNASFSTAPRPTWWKDDIEL